MDGAAPEPTAFCLARGSLARGLLPDDGFGKQREVFYSDGLGFRGVRFPASRVYPRSVVLQSLRSSEEV